MRLLFSLVVSFIFSLFFVDSFVKKVSRIPKIDFQISRRVKFTYFKNINKLFSKPIISEQYDNDEPPAFMKGKDDQTFGSVLD